MKLTALAILLLLAAAPAAATVPPAISYQGVLTDNAGLIVPDGPYSLTFRIWDVPAGGGPANLLYCETQAAVPVVRGGFSVLIGNGATCPPSVPLDALQFGIWLWLEVQVGADPPLAPRVLFTPAPYSMMARTVLPDGIASVNVLDASLTGVDVADNTIQAADISPNLVSSIEGVSNDGGNVDLVPGPGLTITPDDATNRITIDRQPPTYRVSGGLNIMSINATSVWTKISDVLTFTKASGSSSIEVVVNTRAFSGTFAGGAVGVYYAIRIDDVESSLSNQGAITTSGAVDFLSMFSAFNGLAAGSHTVSIWARTSVGTSTSVGLDPGGWGGRAIVKEAQ